MQTSSFFARAASILIGAAAVSVASAAVLCPETASAQPSAKTAQDAKDHFLQGVELFKESAFQTSLTEFKRSYELVPKYDVLYNIGEVYFQLQDFANALKTLQLFLDQGGARIPASKRAQVEKDVEKLRARVATVVINVSVPGAEVFVDDTPIGLSPLKDPVLISGGKRRFMATKDGYNPARDVREFAGGDRGDLTLSMTPLQPGQVQPQVVVQPQTAQPWQPPVPQQPLVPPPSSQPSLVGPIVGFSLTGAAAIVWGVTGGLALSADADLTKLKGTATSQDALTSQANKAKTFALVSDVMMGVSIAGAAASTVITVVVVTRSKKLGATGANLDLHLGLTGASLAGSF